MSPHLTDSKYKNDYAQQVKNKSDVLVNYFLACYFIVGLVLAFFYNTWLVAIGVGGLSIIAYYAARHFLTGSAFYQYVLSAVLGIFMVQFIYQMHGLFEMQFAAFIGCALLVTYQKWKLQLPLLAVVIVHQVSLAYLQFRGIGQVYFAQQGYMDMQTFTMHILFTSVIFFLGGLMAYQFNKYSATYNKLNFDMGRMEEEEQQKKKLLQMRDHLKASNTRLSEAEQIAGMGNWERNYVNNILIWSDQMFRIFDIDNTGFNVSYDAYLSFIHPDDRESVKHIDKEYERNHQPFSYECRIISLKGIIKTIYVQGKVVISDKNEIVKTQGVVQDITERKRIEEQIRQSEKYNRNTFNLSSEVTPDRICFDKAIWQSINNLQHTQQSGRIEFRVQVNQNAPFHSDEQRVGTIISNLVSNGIKFCNPGAENPFIAISVNTTPQNAEIIFEDNGLGISKEHQHKIFDIFYRAETSAPGSGLGLYLVKEIVDKLDGTIHFESVPGEGTRFKINLKNLLNASNN